MQVIAVFDGTICKNGLLKILNTNNKNKPFEKTIEYFVFRLGEEWAISAKKADLKDPHKELDTGNLESVLDHAFDVAFIESQEHDQAAFLTGYIWAKLNPKIPKDPRLFKVLESVTQKMKKAGLVDSRCQWKP